MRLLTIKQVLRIGRMPIGSWSRVLKASGVIPHYGLKGFSLVARYTLADAKIIIATWGGGRWKTFRRQNEN